jgi:ABC-type transporter Mla MlaB component
MKTTKRKRSTKSTPAVEVLDSAPAAASAEPSPVAVVATESANDPIVAEAVVAEVVAAEAAVESVADEAVVVASEEVAVEPVVAAAPSAPVAAVPVANKQSSADPVVVLAANCSVKDASALKNSLCAVANESNAVTLDTSAVERVDTATMQLLCAFVRDRIARKQSIVWRGESQALSDAVRLLGVGALIGFDKGVAA